MKISEEYPNWNNVGSCSHLDIENCCVKCGRYIVYEKEVKRFYLTNGVNYLNRKIKKEVI